MNEPPLLYSSLIECPESNPIFMEKRLLIKKNIKAKLIIKKYLLLIKHSSKIIII